MSLFYNELYILRTPLFNPQGFIDLLSQEDYFLPSVSFLAISECHTLRTKNNYPSEALIHEGRFQDGVKAMDEALAVIKPLTTPSTLLTLKALLLNERVVRALMDTADDDKRAEFTTRDWFCSFSIIKKRHSNTKEFAHVSLDILRPLLFLVGKLEPLPNYHVHGARVVLGINDNLEPAVQEARSPKPARKNATLRFAPYGRKSARSPLPLPSASAASSSDQYHDSHPSLSTSSTLVDLPTL
ncbi:hypothetical protein H0H81_009430 [Sphagnurus paluster]|uniref:Uncharacterized protein n=1 Tax=Sphagnurus paluster TaxID=117069 RepID=A0A9P7FTK8_9AGAR|nr:hypothetical protein H0H81_009430 [Sphagnurus paluster]